jgi:hypothetical protein
MDEMTLLGMKHLAAGLVSRTQGNWVYKRLNLNHENENDLQHVPLSRCAGALLVEPSC